MGDCPNLCSICYEALERDLVATRCGHVFHHHCIKRWIPQKSKCPLCQHKTSEHQLVKLFINPRDIADYLIDVKAASEGLESGGSGSSDGGGSNGGNMLNSAAVRTMLESREQRLKASERQIEVLKVSLQEALVCAKNVEKNYDNERMKRKKAENALRKVNDRKLQDENQFYEKCLENEDLKKQVEDLKSLSHRYNFRKALEEGTKTTRALCKILMPLSAEQIEDEFNNNLAWFHREMKEMKESRKNVEASLNEEITRLKGDLDFQREEVRSYRDEKNDLAKRMNTKARALTEKLSHARAELTKLKSENEQLEKKVVVLEARPPSGGGVEAGMETPEGGHSRKRKHPSDSSSGTQQDGRRNEGEQDSELEGRGFGGDFLDQLANEFDSSPPAKRSRTQESTSGSSPISNELHSKQRVAHSSSSSSFSSSSTPLADVTNNANSNASDDVSDFSDDLSIDFSSLQAKSSSNSNSSAKSLPRSSQNPSRSFLLPSSSRSHASSLTNASNKRRLDASRSFSNAPSRTLSSSSYLTKKPKLMANSSASSSLDDEVITIDSSPMNLSSSSKLTEDDAAAPSFSLDDGDDERARKLSEQTERQRQAMIERQRQKMAAQQRKLKQRQKAHRSSFVSRVKAEKKTRSKPALSSGSFGTSSFTKKTSKGKAGGSFVNPGKSTPKPVSRSQFASFFKKPRR